VAEDEAGEPAVRPIVDKLITDLAIRIDGTNFLGKFDGQEESITGRCDATADSVVGVVEKKLGKNRNGEAGLPSVVEAPLDAKIGLPQAKFCSGSRALDAQPCIFVRELNTIANAEIDIDIGDVGDGLIAIEEGHVTEIDFPIEMAGGAGVIGVIGGTALRECGRCSDEEAE